MTDASQPQPPDTPPPPVPEEGGSTQAPTARAHGGHAALPPFRFLEELKRRNVGRVAILYIAVGYVVLEVFELFFHLLEMPPWTGRAAVLLAILGFPVALVIAWAYEVTPEGLKPTEEVPLKQSIRLQTGRRLDRAIIVMLAVALSYFVVDKFWLSKHAAGTKAAEANVAAENRTTATAAAPAISDKSVAVLPFVDMSEKHDQEYFSDGLSEELIDMLVKVPDLRVPARTSSFFFKNKSEDIPTIARRLLVAHILEGSVRKSGNHLRITAQLVRADNGYHLWSETYDRKVDDIFKVQDEIAAAVVTALKLALDGRPLQRTAGTASAAAYNFYLQALSIQRHNDSRAGTESALDYVGQALAADPGYAAAWARRSMLLDDLHFKQTRTPGKAGNTAEATVAAPRSWEQARAAVNEALRLDPNLAEAHLAAARLMVSTGGNRMAVEEQVRKAVELDPKDSFALSFAAQLAAQRGEFDRALDAAKQAIEADPANPARYGGLADIYYHMRRYDDALAAARKQWELAPALIGKHWYVAQVLFAKGEVAAGLAELDLDPDAKSDYCLGCGFRVMMYDALGRKADAEAALDKLKREHAADGAYEFARIYAERGQLDLAFEWFDRALLQHDDALQWLKFDPLLKNVQGDPRFKVLLHKIGLPE